ncbi:hypothetical protein RHSIM_Rhsim05G0168500 [Rhododendron simsii]|uniref:Uncharacterized protein n=1 Tax=Rhododendron simsii TaxID=118357 RepID=A0A834H0I2_RHOSS|nr:hypothetical protein RHSIM_Rhsim05G0168500 [Rhododendron simsii]
MRRDLGREPKPRVMALAARRGHGWTAREEELGIKAFRNCTCIASHLNSGRKLPNGLFSRQENKNKGKGKAATANLCWKSEGKLGSTVQACALSVLVLRIWKEITTRGVALVGTILMHKFFKEKPIALEDELQFLFQSNMATGEFAYKPSSGIFPELEGDYHVTFMMKRMQVTTAMTI